MLSDVTEKNYHTIRYGTAEGEIQFGHLTQDNVLSGVMLRNGGSLKHYITMDATGDNHRKHGKICRSEGAFQIKAGDNVDEGSFGVFIEAVSGDLVLQAPSGKVRIIGQNVDIIASGSDGKNGVVNINGNEKVIVKSQIIDGSENNPSLLERIQQFLVLLINEIVYLFYSFFHLHHFLH